MDVYKVFVGSLPPELTDEQLKEMFISYGEITESIVMRDPRTGISKKYGFVTFKNQTDAEKAISELDQTEVEGLKMLVTFAKPGT